MKSIVQENCFCPKSRVCIGLNAVNLLKPLLSGKTRHLLFSAKRLHNAHMQDNQAQADYWSSKSGLKWIDFESELDVVFGAVDKALVERSKPSPGERVLDIGCGTGATSRTFSSLVAPGGTICAVDISAPLIEQARQRAKEATVEAQYLLADAQTDQFPDAPFDLVISRFGSMFFADPVAAFVNIRGQIKPSGRMALAAWAPAKGNPWFDVPKDGAVDRLGPLESSDPNAPGPLGFQNAGHVAGILEEAGFKDVNGETIRVNLTHPGPLERAAALASNIGPAARILKKYSGSEEDIEAITDYVIANFRCFEVNGGIRIPANLNFFTARNPG
ncbi:MULTISPECIES: class I SAM-dependent methyltransferase [unclassified Ruegeria]|uniref:class I SAM-dependent methyltransferase n=1 Tax=unclassified Ruegeria TaxID=2625375 RepID=UPI001487E60A|nr:MULTISPECIES: class I SAM-dependent methyltransferase [unclassified Ruegeria]NOD46948.1 methyltransferase domain-containing protein [Ruegeria sp. HKCCD5849]NOD51271.1 methyltransferase domain-containing protein [Ruegeria sp. HKCCD5851]NOD68090.1 methyltransferase domain-containing protein [Ruegeria sp. HKCCD7303]NOE33480.1 methyltransferase domain-containing protein [Ruegeria sp. HKCCD7318]